MARVIGALLLFGAIVTAAKLAIIILILAGLIFRTKETLGLLLVLGGRSLKQRAVGMISGGVFY